MYLPAVSMVTSLSTLYTIYLFLRFPLCLSHSVLIFLILLSSLPPFLLLYPTPSSLRLLSLFTFICLSPFSPLQACHSIMLVFWFLLIERKFYRFPCQFCIFNHFQFIQPTFNAIESCIKLSWAGCASVCVHACASVCNHRCGEPLVFYHHKERGMISVMISGD